VPGYGSTYFLRDVPTADSIDHQMLPVAEMVSLLQKGDKFGFLSLVKSALDEYGHNRGLTGEHLRRMYRELSQVVYTVLGDASISVTDLFDEDLSVLARNAQSSTMGMIRFSNYLVERALDVIAETKQKETLADKVDRYIRENYRREITTGELGEFFHMNGEYLNKSYRKERGVGIKDALNEYRIEEAKKLLLGSDEAISNIATEVGFDNFTYFSTLFKKYTGSTPSQFRKTESGV
ncbi:MAG: helix-turn-helix domain-containing protein, partial [Lachnospiraceae bacterium]|nr:helix-turn-helix domain-containing protein [Lachnospiraceae bacterium]